jgi:hypothetical protein
MNTLTVRPAAELDELLTAVRAAVARNTDWRDTASLHVYGTDLGRIGSSARRFYDLPVRPAELRK